MYAGGGPDNAKRKGCGMKIDGRRRGVIPQEPKRAAEAAAEIADAARDVPLPPAARELVEILAQAIDDLSAMVDPPQSHGY
jgi:hypothetical protein